MKHPDYKGMDSDATDALGEIIESITDTGAEVSMVEDIQPHDSRSAYDMSGERIEEYYHAELTVTFNPKDVGDDNE